MEPQDIINEVKSLIDNVSSRGQKVLFIEPFKKYLNSLEANISESIEHRARVHESSLAEYTARVQYGIEMFRSVIEAGKSALQALLLINGGAVVALLGILSNHVDSPSGRAFVHGLALPLLQFGSGVFCGALGLAFRYCSQACYATAIDGNPKWNRIGKMLTGVSILSGLAGYILFMVAVTNAYDTLITSFSK